MQYRKQIEKRQIEKSEKHLQFIFRRNIKMRYIVNLITCSVIKNTLIITYLPSQMEEERINTKKHNIIHENYGTILTKIGELMPQTDTFTVIIPIDLKIYINTMHKLNEILKTNIKMKSLPFP